MSDPAPADAKVNQYTATPFDRRRYDPNGNLIMTAPPPPAGGSGILGDGDHDGDVDADDVAAFQACMPGPTVPPASGCASWDFDLDGDVDLADFALMQHLSGAGVLQGDPNIAYDYRNRMIRYWVILATAPACGVVLTQEGPYDFARTGDCRTES